jgi:hypothetical protein
MRHFATPMVFVLSLLLLVSIQKEPAIANSKKQTVGSGVTFNLSKIDSSVVKEFEKIWRIAKSGLSNCEGALLIFKMDDGRYRAKTLPATNEYQRISFTWHPTAIAIVHTHPNHREARPSWEDRTLADHYGVFMFTVSNRGMYVYDPHTKKLSKVMDGLDWLEPSKWSEEFAAKMAGNSSSFSCGSR